MKTRKTKPQDTMAILKGASTKKLFKHFLSPLDQAAMRRLYKPFVFKFEGLPVYVSAYDCKYLLHLSKQKLNLVSSIVHKNSQSKNIPMRLRPMFDDPQIILSLRPRLRNQLCRLECYTLFDIMQKGRGYFMDQQKFTPAAMQTLDAMFRRYGCRRLFK